MRSQTFKRLILVVAIGCGLIALLVGVLLLALTPWVSKAERIIANTTSCFDRGGAACDSDIATTRYVEGATGVELPADAELLFSRSNENSLQTASSGFAIFATSEPQALIASDGYDEVANMVYSRKARSDVPDLLEHFGFTSVTSSIQEQDREAQTVTTISIAATSQPGRFLVIVGQQRYH